jgi:hypothetical protein
LIQLLSGRSASIDAPSAARQSSRAHSNNLQALCDAIGNSTSSSRESTSREPRAPVVNQRRSEDAKVRITVSKKLDRRRKRRLGTSNNIPGISTELWLKVRLIASSGNACVDPAIFAVIPSEAKDHAND